MKLESSEYNPNGGAYNVCPSCDAFHYVDDLIGLSENEAGYNYFCSNCGAVFYDDDNSGIDPSEKELEKQFKSMYAFETWRAMTPTDKRSHYNDYTDSLCKNGDISDFMYYSMNGLSIA